MSTKNGVTRKPAKPKRGYAESASIKPGLAVKLIGMLRETHTVAEAFVEQLQKHADPDFECGCDVVEILEIIEDDGMLHDLVAFANLVEGYLASGVQVSLARKEKKS